MLLFYDLILVSLPENIYHNVCKWLNDKNIYEIFEFPLVYGQTIYFVPNIKKINLQEEIDKYEFKLFDGAGADKINDDIWEVGIEVLPEYRKDGLATILTKNLTMKILEKGIVPIWAASVSNIGSQAVATNSDYIPLWMETFGDVFDKDYPFKEITKNMNL